MTESPPTPPASDAPCGAERPAYPSRTPGDAREGVCAPVSRPRGAEASPGASTPENGAQGRDARAALRTLIAGALAREDAHNAGYDHGFVSTYGIDDETDGFVDAVLAVLPSPTDQGAEVEIERLRAENVDGAAALAEVRGFYYDALQDRNTHYVEARKLRAQVARLRTDRATWLREAADRYRGLVRDVEQPEFKARYEQTAVELSRMADEAQPAPDDVRAECTECDDTGACAGGPCAHPTTRALTEDVTE